MTKQLILASTSPRRQELLKQVSIPFVIRKKEVDESQVKNLPPAELVKVLCKLKGKSVPIQHDDEVILAADTIVSYQNQIFGKPKNKDKAFSMLKKLSGNTHEVFTGVYIASKNKERVFVEETKVQFWDLSDEDIYSYIQSGEPYDKAGGYGIQGMGSLLVKKIDGDYFNVVGLPISKCVRELRSFSITPN
jgi:septum formation protein